MARKRPEHLNYEDLYLYLRAERPRLEGSYLDSSTHTLEILWITQAQTGCGMSIFRPPLQRETVYNKSPLNSVCFGRTHCDGIHYSFLTIDGYWDELSPVVMTSPAFFPENIVVGETLEEFLCLGLRRGFETLPNHLPDAEGNWDETKDRHGLEAESDDPEDAEQNLALAKLADHFGLTPLTNIAARLTELQTCYQPLIRNPPQREFGWGTGSDVSNRDKVVLAQMLAQYRPGDRVLWDRYQSPRWVTVRARVVAVGTERVTIALVDPATGKEVTRRVHPINLRHQQKA